jgi:hypothetical protein
MSASAPATPRPFWHRLNTFFAFPLQLQPLAYAVVLSLCSLVAQALFFLPQALAFILVELGILLAASRYGFRVTALGSRGIVRAGDFPRELDEDWTNLPWKLFAVSLVQGFAVGALALLSPVLASVGLFAVSFLFPATVIVLVQSCSFWQSLNPTFLWMTVRAIGWPYALLCLFLFLLSTGAQLALVMVMPAISPWLALPIFNFLLIYFGWVMASLLGYVMYQNHVELGIDLLPGAGSDDYEADRRTPAQIARDATDAEVAQLVTDGDVMGALALAYEAQRVAPADDLAAQRRYHRMLLLAPEKLPTMLDHARRFIEQLIRRDLASEALKVYRACEARDPSFRIEDGDTVLAFARLDWRSGDARAALAWLKGFDKRFRGHEAIPLAYELAARVLVEGLDRADLAKPILSVLEARYPDAAQTQEVRWLLRDRSAPLARAPSAPSAA